MGNEPLANLVRTGALKAEPADKNECIGLVRSALDRLVDAHNSALSYASRFDLAYNSAHALALAAMRLKGYRSDRRYLVFQCLPHTLSAGAAFCAMPRTQKPRQIRRLHGHR